MVSNKTICSIGMESGKLCRYWRGSFVKVVHTDSIIIIQLHHDLVFIFWLQVYDSTSSLNQTVEYNLQQLEGQYAQHADYLSIIQKLQGQLDELVKQMVEIPFWENPNISLEELAVNIELYDWYR